MGGPYVAVPCCTVVAVHCHSTGDVGRSCAGHGRAALARRIRRGLHYAVDALAGALPTTVPRLHPPEFELLVIIFVFASLFLGEVRGYYVRFWWWDLALHSGSALLLGMFSFMLVYVLNEERHIELHMKAGFAAFFSFTFALGVGALWEIFEFGMDGVFGLNMQKSGLVDTMWDLIVDAAGALLVSVLGYAWMRSGTESFVSRGIARFVQANPQFFERRQR